MSFLLFYKNLLTTNWIWIRKILYWALGWIILGSITPLIFPSVAHFFVELLTQAFKTILGGSEFTSNFYTAWLIFSQNARAALILLFLGIIIGLLPRISIGFNAFMVGIILANSFQKGLVSGLAFILVLIPHGIFEIPALIISAAFGIRLGWFWKISEPTLTTKQKFFLALKQNVQLIPLIISLLVIAAGIEVFVSGAIANHFTSYIKK